MDAEISRNTDIVKKIYQDFALRNIPEIISMLDPDVEWGEPDNPFNPAGGTRFGHEGFLNWLKIGRRIRGYSQIGTASVLS